MKSKLKAIFESFIWLFVLLLGVDIITKNLVVYYAGVDPRLMTYVPGSGATGIVLIPNFLRINYLVNQNVAFGLGFGDADVNRIVFIIVALLISAILVFVFAKFYRRFTKFVRACFMLILVGAIGNAIDRIFFTGSYLHFGYNGVVDWIDFYGIWQFNFNIADSCVVVGAIMLIIWLIVSEIKDSMKDKKKQDKSIPKSTSTKILSVEEKKRLESENKNKEENQNQ
ncbi:MAG: signal peptidase II [Bacilli bacterium]|nr:signal peptidase II [Bacilli bacterium]